MQIVNVSGEADGGQAYIFRQGNGVAHMKSNLNVSSILVGPPFCVYNQRWLNKVGGPKEIFYQEVLSIFFLFLETILIVYFYLKFIYLAFEMQSCQQSFKQF